jgi:predicted ester cyclase
MSKENESVVQRFLEECLNQRNPDRIDDLFSPNYVNNAATPDISPDLEGYKQRVAYMLNGFPDLHIEIEDIFSAGDRVAIRLTASGTHKAECMGIAPTGRHATWTAIAIYQVQNGRIVQRWENRDDLGLMRQLGAIKE